MKNKLLTVALAASWLISGCSREARDGELFTLYRSSVTDANMRLHIATFDASDGESYNRENCELARELFQAQPSVRTKFWCEKGLYKK